ncbi:hypothetical protein [Cupriavidus pauculus]|uniref:Uracil-DNA glycosylase-like domain-containing protein n=1 Tax=Cupriavidus pauculus TaxID=82633 RepID=A0A2N5C2U0_9BURK|nr:hypothetical protein [Cupriavidus pauculus]PLP96500.1 hypothetical protein CYJ10_32275 [Cupriavidus pauculus]
MTSSDLQARLDAYYLRALADAKTGFEPHFDVLSAPFLLSVSDDYLDAAVRIMFIGKETNGWYGKLGAYYQSEDSLEKIKLRYADQFKRGTSGSPFLRRTKAVAGELAGGKRTAICWNNLMKMDWDQGKSGSRNSLKHSKELFDFSVATVRFEIEVLKPDLIILGCGSSYDSAVHAILPNRVTQYKVPRRLWHFQSNGIECFRTYHPGARQTPATGPIEVYYDDIVGRAKARFAKQLAQGNLQDYLPARAA